MLCLYYLWCYVVLGKIYYFWFLLIMEKYGLIYLIDEIIENKLKVLCCDMMIIMKDLIEKGVILEYNIINVKDDKIGNIIDYIYEMYLFD